MRKEEFTKGALTKIKETLAEAGIPDFIIEQLDVAIYVALIIFVAYIAGRVLHKISTSVILHFQKKKRFPLLANLIEYDVLKKISLLAPPVIVIWLLPVAFTHRPKLSAALEYKQYPGAMLFQYGLNYDADSDGFAKSMREAGFLTYTNILNQDKYMLNGNYTYLQKFVNSETDFIQTDYFELVNED